MLKVNIKQLFLFIFVGLVAMSCDDDDNLMGPEHTDADGMILELDGNEVYRELDGEVLVNNLSLIVNSTLELSVHFLDEDGEEMEHEEDDHAEGEEEDELTFTGYDNTVISLEVEEHCDEIANQTNCEASDHCEWHADEGECEDEGHADDGCDTCVASCITYVVENYGYTEEAANEWCLSTPNSSYGCADSCSSDHEEHHELGFELTGLSAGSTFFSVSLMHDGHADYVSLLIPITVSTE